MSACGEQQCIHIRVAPPYGTEVDIMGVDRLLQSMTGRGDRAGSRQKLPALLYPYNGLYSIYIHRVFPQLQIQDALLTV